MNKAKRLVASACVIVWLATLVSGCAIINEIKAVGDSPEAVDAVALIDNEGSLWHIASSGKNVKAREAAVSKMNNLQDLILVIRKENTWYPESVKVAAAKRVLALGMVGNACEDHDFINSIAEGAFFSTDVRVATVGYMSEYQLREIINNISTDTDTRLVALKRLMVLDEHSAECCIRDIVTQPVPMTKITEVKKSGGKNIQTESVSPQTDFFEKLLEGEVPDKVLMRIATTKGIDTDIRERALEKIQSQEVVSLVAYGMSNIEFHSRDLFSKGDSAEEAIIKKAIARLSDNKILAKFIKETWFFKKYDRGPYDDYRILAVERMTDDSLLSKIAVGEHNADVAMVALRKIRNDVIRESVEAQSVLMYGTDENCKAKVFEDFYVKDKGGALKFMKDEIAGISEDVPKLGMVPVLASLGDVDILWASMSYLTDAGKAPHAELSPYNQKKYRAAEKRIFELTENSLVGDVAVLQSEAERLMALAKNMKDRCVIGGYYVGMPLRDFCLLNKIGRANPVCQSLDYDENKKCPIVKVLVFDAKSLYMTTGLEQSQLFLHLPSKLGVAPFEFGMTKVSVGQDWFTNEYKVSGGETYYKSETVAKNAYLLFWKKQGKLVVSNIE